jgi:urea transport system ATP-binding protein
LSAPCPLRVEHISKSFGGARIIEDVSFVLEAGEIRLLLGPNGAGKTTLMRCVSGFLPHDRGRIYVHGTDVAGSTVHLRQRLGVGFSFQKPQFSPALTIRENVMASLRPRGGVLRSIFRAPTVGDRSAVTRTLQLVRLEGKADELASRLTAGERRRLDLACTLVESPSVVLLDEPSSGLTDNELPELMGILQTVARTSTLLVVDHRREFFRLLHAAQATAMCLVNGTIVGTVTDVESCLGDPRVRSIYFGSA